MQDFFVTRRQIVAGAAALGGLSLLGTPARSQPPAMGKTPDVRTFRAGDFIWPKKEGQFVPYSGAAREGAVVDESELTEDEWNRLRVQYIRRARGADSISGPDAAYRKQIADRLEEMTYTEFFHDYAAGITPSRFQAYGLSSLFYVGHMAIIDLEAATDRPFVVEAVMGKSIACRSCVQRVPYDVWLKHRGDIYVWHGRVRSTDTAAGAKIARAAVSQVGKPYDFMNWDLLDESGFYCSKLAWYATYKAIDLPLDANRDPKRQIWFSPLQAVRRTKEVELLFNPGNYQNL